MPSGFSLLREEASWRARAPRVLSRRNSLGSHLTDRSASVGADDSSVPNRPASLEHASASTGETRETRRAHIAVVDDDREVLHVIAEFLQVIGHTVECFTSPIDALDRLTAHDRPGFDLLMTDFRMPDMMGDQLAACLRDVSPGLPIIIVTAFPAAGDNVRAELANISMLQKPFGLAGLREIVQRALG
jgi:CheY-like chemotaxis protein